MNASAELRRIDRYRPLETFGPAERLGRGLVPLMASRRRSMSAATDIGNLSLPER